MASWCPSDRRRRRPTRTECPTGVSMCETAAMEFRTATRADVPAVLRLLADDDISRDRGFGDAPPVAEDVDAAIWAAFEEIDADANNELLVADDDGEIVATCQLTFIPGLSRGGARRMTIEAVRVRSDRRGAGLGRE